MRIACLARRRDRIDDPAREIGGVFERWIVHALAQPPHLLLHEIAVMSIAED